jgi:hypothetical protein
MSYVSNVILSFSIMEDEVKRIKDVNDKLTKQEQRGFVFPDGQDWHGGSKALERPTFLAAFNYLDLERFIWDLATCNWDVPEEVQVFICDQHEDLYREVPLPWARS